MMAVFLIVGGICLKREERRPVIGVTMWDGDGELYDSVAMYADQLKEILDVDLQILSLYKTGLNSYIEIVREFCKNGGDVLINVETEDLYEIMKICEMNGVYLLQMWEMSDDTDILYRLYGNPYFLGYIVSDEEAAGQKMAEQIRSAGCLNNVVMTFQQGNVKNMVHHLRKEEFCKGLEPLVPVSVLEISRFDEGIKYLAKLNIEIDGLLLSRFIVEYSLDTIKSIIGNPEMKFTYFDTNEHTREELEDGDLVMVSCGQQNVFILAVTYADAFIENQKESTKKLEITCPYLNITSTEEYDLYQKNCLQQMPYSAENINILKESLKNDTNLLEEYAESYSIEWLNTQ